MTHDQEVIDESAANKIQETVIAQLSVAGFLVHTLDDGGFLVCRWAHARHCHDLRELRQFSRAVGVTQ